MMNISGKGKKTYIIFIIGILALILMSGGAKRTYAAATEKIMCKVIFANSEGKVSSEKYRDWAKTVEKETVIQLPKTLRKGYKAVWETKISGKTYQYSPGSKVTVKKDMRFCLKYYKKYSVRFYTSNGKSEYTNLRKTVIEGEKILLPSIPTTADYRNLGWSTDLAGKTLWQRGKSVRIRENLKLYAIREKARGVRLYKNNGIFWKNLSFSKNQKAVFPAVTTGNGDMVLGWSRKKGMTTHPDYYAGDAIPNLSGKYYMVVFHQSQDTAASVRAVQNKYHTVYFVGDSRTLGMEKALKKQNIQNTKFVYKAGMGLQWFKSTGFARLYKDVKKQPKEQKKAVIINLGVNDLDSAALYVKYMKKVAEKLKPYNCKMYYLSVNPVNTAMIEKYRGHSQSSKSEVKVQAFNRYIYNELCYGRKKTFIYINTCSRLRKNGWISSKNNRNIFDGVHYSNETYFRIYDYCMKTLDK